jgi:hypothetical protein
MTVRTELPPIAPYLVMFHPTNHERRTMASGVETMDVTIYRWQRFAVIPYAIHVLPFSRQPFYASIQDVGI